ncbi:DNA-binding protein [Izhakiella australiensis]|uniref:DNA-binding protein n=1 Tax=Izhakiella australiensis TaxID=1926881 RepID=A0A1S8YL72_9GAMM|nr:PLP-dependent aminotransferase family protein [Izhakiella australiensis]OON39423.1 DNA-binding protein [Izhakiella australiensis]
MRPPAEISDALGLLFQPPLQREPGGPTLPAQIMQRLRLAILDGRLLPGCRLPGSRELAQRLGVSRNSVTTAYELLGTEGYIMLSRQGTRVAQLHQHQPATPLMPQPDAQLAGRLERLKLSQRAADDNAPFRPGVPALSRFPLAAWRRCVDRALREDGHRLLGYGDPLGEPLLRQAIIQHLALTRGVRATADQVVITEGAQEALMLCVRLLTNPAERVWLEDPGYRGAVSAFQCGDLKLVPLPVDSEGLCVPAAQWQQPPRLIYTTPSHQYPSGEVMSVRRRLQLIADAQRCGAWIIEDDYDSEFRHTGDLIGAMQGLVPQAPVLYMGTFSKTLFPSLRLGFVILPDDLQARAAALLQETLRGGHRSEQLALARFIGSGQFSRHLGRMRRLYRQRRDALLLALTNHLKVPYQLTGGDSGMHLTIRLPPAWPDSVIVNAAQAYGMAPGALSHFYLAAAGENNGLVLGYGNTAEAQFAPLVQRLSQLIAASRLRD